MKNTNEKELNLNLIKENNELAAHVVLLQSMKDRVNNGKPYSIEDLTNLKNFTNKFEKSDAFISFSKDAQIFMGKLHFGNFPYVYNNCEYIENSNQINVSGEISSEHSQFDI